MEICLDELTSNLPFELGINFKYLETIDHGAFGTVIHVIEISTNKDMAIKVINKSNSKPSVIKKVKEEMDLPFDITISLGVASITAEDNNISDLISKADESQYVAKRKFHKEK